MISVDDVLKILDRIPIWKNLAALPAKVAALEKRVAELETYNNALAEQPATDFIEHKGALFRVMDDGTIDDTVHCPRCQMSVSSFEGDGKFHCSCGWVSPFTEAQVPKILAAIKP